LTLDTPKLLQSRVGKRVLLLFVVTALVPLAAMALLSLSQVRSLLQEQASARLANNAKTYATGVYDRLLTARDVASLLATYTSTSAVTSIANARGFSFLARVDANGKAKIMAGSLTAEAGMVFEENRALIPKAGTMVRPVAGGAIYLLHHAADVAGADVLIGKLDAKYVWGDEEDRKAGMIVCVAERVSNALLYCPDGGALDLPARLSRIEDGKDLREVLWTRQDVAYRGRVWAQFMKNDFGRPDWYFAVSVPEDEVLAAVHAFRGVFFPVVLLALLLIGWLSVRQIRAMLIPLGNLTAATRRVTANDFGARASVNSNDEFGELADAFNSMSIRLGRQFQVSRVHGEIDRLILERNALQDIIESTLIQAGQLLPSMQLCAILLDRDDPLSGCVYKIGTDGKVTAAPVGMPSSAWPDPSSPVLVRYQHDEPAPDWLKATESAAPAGSSQLWTQALVWGKTMCGWLLVEQTGDAAVFPDEDRRTLGEIAGRLSIAIASAWREDELFQRAHFDPLTGLPNRSLFSDRLQHEIVRGRREGRSLAIMFVDLDRFKSVNDAQGHSAGDMLLCEAASRIKSITRESDTVSRHGGDEFTVLLTDIREQRDALVVGNNIIAALSKPFLIGDQSCFLSATIGIAIFPDNGATAELLMKHADTAMYRAKSTGRGQALFFEERMNAEVVTRLAVDRELRRAIEQGELELYYQPQVSLRENKVVACEALLRWNHPVRGVLAPGAFIDIAEEGGLINIIGRWVIEESCRQIVRWRAEGMQLERVSVNVSARQFREADFVGHIRSVVLEKGLATSIELEITESVMLEQTDMLEGKLLQISEFGCTIALDDFGTGFSSMAYLKKLPVDVVKIDRMFIEDIDRSSDGRAFVEAIISMAHALGKQVIAEGVERDTQTSILRELRCDVLQGYRYSSPVPARKFSQFVENFTRHTGT
jgi:diguanylate cyclase